MSELVKVSEDAGQLRRSIADALAYVASISDAGAASDAYDSVRLAKEFARIRKIAREVRVDLLRLEIHLYRKCAQLDMLTALPTAQRAAAKFYGGATDEQIEQWVAEFGDVTTPAAVMKRILKTDEMKQEYARYASGEYAAVKRYVDDEARGEAVRAQARNMRESLASILENYYEYESQGFSVLTVAEQLCEQVGLDERSAIWGKTQGLLEVCRKAVREAPPVAIDGTNAPKFITCMDRSCGNAGVGSTDLGWIRVPFHSATLDQFHDMVRLREHQAEQARATADRMSLLWNRLWDAMGEGEREDGVTLGELAGRIAFATDVA